MKTVKIHTSVMNLVCDIVGL